MLTAAWKCSGFELTAFWSATAIKRCSVGDMFGKYACHGRAWAFSNRPGSLYRSLWHGAMRYCAEMLRWRNVNLMDLRISLRYLSAVKFPSNTKTLITIMDHCWKTLASAKLLLYTLPDGTACHLPGTCNPVPGFICEEAVRSELLPTRFCYDPETNRWKVF